MVTWRPVYGTKDYSLSEKKFPEQNAGLQRRQYHNFLEYN